MQEVERAGTLGEGPHKPCAFRSTPGALLPSRFRAKAGQCEAGTAPSHPYYLKQGFKPKQ